MSKFLGQSFWGVWLMGSSTVRGFPGRLRFFQFLLLALFALIFAGCEELEEGDSTSPGSSPPLSTHTFGNKVKVRFMVPTVDGPVEVTNNESLQRALKRAVPPPENVRAQGTPAEYVGNILTSDNGFGIYPADTSGEIEVYNSLAKAVVGAFIIDTQAINTGYDTGTITYRYYPPSLDQGLSLSTFITNDITSEYSVSDSSVVRAGDPVEVQVNYVYVTDYPGGVLNRVYNGTISLNGEVVFTFENVRSTGDSEFLPVTPCFASKESGEARLELMGNRGDERQSDFIQKGLEFRQETQDFEIQPNQTASIHNDFGWDLGANPDSLVQPSWEVEIVDPQKQVIKTFSGSGRQISANWTPEGLSSPIRLVPIDRLSQDGEVPVYGYRLKAKAKIGDPVFGTGSIFYELSNDSRDGEIQIVNIDLTPDRPFQNPGDTVQLTAEVLAVGIGGLTDDDISWWVDLIGPDGNRVGDDPLATGDGFDIAATWDGKVGGVVVENPLSYALRIKAFTNCSGISPRQSDIRARAAGCEVAQANVQLPDDQPQLLVFDGQNKRVATSLLAMLTHRDDRDQSTTDRQRELLRARRDELGRIQSSQSFSVVARALKFTDSSNAEVDAPQVLKLRVRALSSGSTFPAGQNETITLTKLTSDADGATYVSDVFALPEGFVKTDQNFAKTRFSLGEIYRDRALVSNAPGGVTGAYRTLIQSLAFFLKPALEVGLFAETAIDSGTLTALYPTRAPEEGVVPPTPDNLLTTGFETLEFVLEPDPNAKPQVLTRALVKVVHPANQVVWSYHGIHDGTLYLRADRDAYNEVGGFDQFGNPLPSDPAWQLPPSAAATKLQGVDTLMMVACSTLDVNDYNNFVAQQSGGVWPTAVDRDYGGERWDAVRRPRTTQPDGTVVPGTVLLGYNSFAPFQNAAGTENIPPLILAKYQQYLATFSQGSGDAKKYAQSWAWMAANVKIADESTVDTDSKWMALHASAIDDDYYYYVPLENEPVKRKIGDVLLDYPKPGSVDPVTPVYRVARADWVKDPQFWEYNKLNIAKRVAIQGLTYTP